MARIDPTIIAGIHETARALGVDPVDLATAISYETAGTFSPTKRGPRTKWGQHRGLIQFGELQARKHGVDWKNPIKSQLGPQGAVAKYLRAAGVKPGMGLLDIYSAINAGAPGLYNRSDEKAGGAPGTVRDKVEKQMGPHRAKAARLLRSVSAQPSRTSEPEKFDPSDWQLRGVESQPAQSQNALGPVIVHTTNPNALGRPPAQRVTNDGPLPAHTLAELERYRQNPGPAPSGVVMGNDRPNALGRGPRGWY